MNHPTPTFSIASLILATASVAVGIAVMIAPATPPNSFGVYTFCRQAAQGLLWMAAFWMLIEMTRHSVLIHRAQSSIPSEFSFANRLAVIKRILLASMLLSLLIVKMLFIRGVIEYPKNREYLPLGNSLWPSAMLSITLLACLFTIHAKQISREKKRTVQSLMNTVVYIGLIILGFYIVTNQQFIAALVHIAIAGINIANPIHIRRVGVFPNHAAEGYLSFWMAAAAVGLVCVAGLLLLLDAKAKRPRVRRGARVMFGVIATIVGVYIVWFKQIEFPRINPEMAVVGWAALWHDFVAGGLIALGLSVFFAWSLSTYRSPANLELPIAPNLSRLTSVASLGIVISESWSFVDGASQLFSISLLFSDPLDQLMNILETIGYLLVMPDVTISLLLILTSIGVLGRAIRKKDNVLLLPAIDGREFAFYLFASIIFTIVAIPALAIYGFCWWLGPFV